MKQKPQESEKNFSKDQKTFEKLPTDTQEALLLGDQSEKASGKQRVAIDNKIKRHDGQEE